MKVLKFLGIQPSHASWVLKIPDNEEHNGANDEKYNNDWHEENQSSPESNVF